MSAFVRFEHPLEMYMFVYEGGRGVKINEKMATCLCMTYVNLYISIAKSYWLDLDQIGNYVGTATY